MMSTLHQSLEYLGIMLSVGMLVVILLGGYHMAKRVVKRVQSRKRRVIKDTTFQKVLDRTTKEIEKSIGELTTKASRLMSEVAALERRHAMLKELRSMYKGAVELQKEEEKK